MPSVRHALASEEPEDEFCRLSDLAAEGYVSQEVPSERRSLLAVEAEVPEASELEQPRGAGDRARGGLELAAGALRVRPAAHMAARCRGRWSSIGFGAAGALGFLCWAGSGGSLRPRRSPGLLLEPEAAAAFERLGRLLEASGDPPIDVQVPGAPHEINQTKLAYTQCVVDVGQAAVYLGQGIVFIDKAVRYGGSICPDDTKVGCAVQIEAAVTALIWFASYISLAMSSCTASVNAPAACAADVTGIMGNLGELATASTAASVDCRFEHERRGFGHFSLGRRLAALHNVRARRLDGSHPLAGVVDLLKEQQAKRAEARQAEYEQQIDHALCAFDVVHGVSYVIRATKQILGAAVDECGDQQICAINILNIISSVAWISQFFSLAAGDCVATAGQAPYCAGDISDLIAATTNGAAICMAIKTDCDATEKQVKWWGGNSDVDKLQETKRRLRPA